MFALASYLRRRIRIRMKSSRVAITYCLCLLKIVLVLIRLTGTSPHSPSALRDQGSCLSKSTRHKLWINLSWRLKRSSLIHNTGPQDPIYPVNGFVWDQVEIHVLPVLCLTRGLLGSAVCLAAGQSLCPIQDLIGTVR